MLTELLKNQQTIVVPMPVIPACGRLKQENCWVSEASLAYILGKSGLYSQDPISKYSQYGFLGVGVCDARENSPL